ncbi:protein of unknown function [Caloramator quimbayensis]|uniref:DUF4355 domain-containing protein n=1 Tax=Caloramator quimbayensis TaxID=1147123 RepID=A0A1T4YCW1_9CLOT|nr:DUF4355 domain-containing protein [Caloramator quimbayensis]SKA99368.1 protein of unknown function [Caloramator quimbayensis]
MTQEEIKALLDELSKGTDSLINYIKGLKPTEAVTLDGVKKFLEDSEEGKKLLQSLTDKRVTEGIETFKKNNLEKLIEEEMKKRFPDADPKDAELKKLQAEIEKIKAEALRKDLTNKAIKIATDKKLPVELIDFLIGNDEETTTKNLETLEKSFNSRVEAAVQERLKGSYQPPKDNSNPADVNDLAGAISQFYNNKK